MTIVGNFPDLKTETTIFELTDQNGFFREFLGNAANPDISVTLRYEENSKNGKPTGNLILILKNYGATPLKIKLKDKSYKQDYPQFEMRGKDEKEFRIDLSKSFCWHDFTVRVDNFPNYEERFAGKVETGQ